MDLLERFDAVFALDGAAPAVGYRDEFYSYDMVAALGAKLAAMIKDAGFGAGTPVGVLLRNRPAHFAAALGLLRAGHCIVTVNPMLPAGPLGEDILSLKVPLLVADEEDWNNPAFGQAAERAGAIGISIKTLPDRLAIVPAGAKYSGRTGGYRDCVPDVAVEMLSSGTTGKPKRIKLERQSLAKSLWAGSQYEAGADAPLALKNSPNIQWMPLVHIAGLFGALYSVYNGRRFVLMEKFDLQQWHDLIMTYRPRFANIPPSHMRALLERGWPKEDFSSLLALRTGAAPLDHQLAIDFEQLYGVPVLEGYGATEFAGGVAGWTIRDHRKYAATKRDSVGRANAGVELRVVDRETFAVLPAGAHGLLEVRSEQNDGGRSWLRTTDIAHLDEEGFLYIHGRADNAINRGGFKVLPGPVEDVLRLYPGVREASVVGVPDEQLGQVPAAAIELQAGAAAPDLDQLRRFMRERLKAYEVPVRFIVVDELPRTPSLKVSQPLVRDLFSPEDHERVS